MRADIFPSSSSKWLPLTCSALPCFPGPGSEELFPCSMRDFDLDPLLWLRICSSPPWLMSAAGKSTTGCGRCRHRGWLFRAFLWDQGYQHRKAFSDLAASYTPTSHYLCLPRSLIIHSFWLTLILSLNSWFSPRTWRVFYRTFLSLLFLFVLWFGLVWFGRGNINNFLIYVMGSPLVILGTSLNTFQGPISSCGERMFDKTPFSLPWSLLLW